MKYKELVLARFPNAKSAVTSLWRDGTPRHYTIITGNQRLEIPVKSDSGWWADNVQRSSAQAWREAYYWMLANPSEGVQTDLFEEKMEIAK